MTIFQAFQSITDVSEYSKLMFSLSKNCKTVKEVEAHLNTPITDSGLQTLKSAARKGYPLSLDGIQ